MTGRTSLAPVRFLRNASMSDESNSTNVSIAEPEVVLDVSFNKTMVLRRIDSWSDDRTSLRWKRLKGLVENHGLKRNVSSRMSLTRVLP